MKALIGIIVVALIAFGAYAMLGTSETEEVVTTTEGSATSTESITEEDKRTLLSAGTYTVIAEESTVGWAGKKPLVEGYINSGSIALTEGTIEVSEASTTGMFIIDMDTLSVTNTPAKPGKESALEGHLKGEGWFNVEEFPTAEVTITSLVPQIDVTQTFMYAVSGTLTMKGETHEITFPAKVYTNEDGTIHADAQFEIDRTKWGITAGSGSFFDNLADNVIDDMIALSFNLTAQAQ